MTINQELTIIVLAFNSEKIIKKCLSSLNLDKYKVIVVDNASCDKTIGVIEENFPTIELIKLNYNSGYGRGNNIALERVKTKFALVLNPDAIIDEQNIEVILSEMKNNHKIAIAGPILLESKINHEAELNNKIEKIEQDYLSKKKRYHTKEKNLYQTKFVSGAVMFFNMINMKEIGFFDKNIFLFYEDDEICHRSSKKGFLNAIITNSIAFHESGTSCKKSSKGSYKKGWHLKGWSKLYFKQIVYGKISAKISSLFYITKYLVKIFGYLFKANFTKLLESFGAISGSFAFLLGLKAFDKNNKPRG